MRGTAAVPARPTMDLSDVRRHHLSVVLEHLLRNGPRSRAVIATETGLTKATVSSLVADLLGRGLVEELVTPRGGRVGRPSTDVGAAGRRVGALGLQIDVDEVAAAVVDLSGEVRSLHHLAGRNSDIPVGRVVDRLRQVTQKAMADADSLGIHCIGATLALPGLVDPHAGTLFVAPNLHWFDTDLRTLPARLRLPLDVPLAVDNEADLAALAELRHGAGQQWSSFVSVTGSVGVGAGIVLGGKVLRGSHGFAGELGHVVVDPEGKPCACGARGCLETLAGGDVDATPTELAEALAAALRTVVHLVDPEAIVLGGRFAELGTPFTADVAERLRAATLGARWHPCEVRPSTLGDLAVLVGAATATLDTIVADPTIVPLRPSPQPA